MMPSLQKKPEILNTTLIGDEACLSQDKSLKVLVISAAFPPMRAGEADQIFHLCRHLSERGIDIHVLTTQMKTLPANLSFKVFPHMRTWSWRDLPRLAKFMKYCSPDAVLLFYSDWTYGRHPMVTFAPVLSKWVAPKAPFVTQFAIDRASIGASFLTRAILKAVSTCLGSGRIDYVLGVLLPMSDRIVVFSERHRALLSEGNRQAEHKTMVIPPPPAIYMLAEDNGKARKRGRELLGVKPDEFLIAHLGYIYSNKGVETLFEAFRALSTQNTKLRLVMVGGDLTASNNLSYAKQIEQIIDQLELTEKIIWTGRFEWNSERGSLYLRAADVCVFPFTEGVTLNRSSLGVAAAHGLPIVTTKGQTVEAPFKDRVNVLLCPPNDPESIAAAVDSLIINPKLRARLAEGALQLARDWFSWDKAVERTVHALENGRRKEKQNWLGIMAVCLSGLSMVVYFFSSYGIKNHVLFIMESFSKVLEKTGAVF
jgi:glycosyltransferase involved in cell wall biosynthesis